VAADWLGAEEVEQVTLSSAILALVRRDLDKVDSAPFVLSP
jgi:hypothetical protein